MLIAEEFATFFYGLTLIRGHVKFLCQISLENILCVCVCVCVCVCEYLLFLCFSSYKLHIEDT
jgi:hypothetical protein